MSQSSLPKSFNARSFAIGLISLALLAAWSHWHCVLVVNRTSLNDNSPPVGAVGIFLGVLLIVCLYEMLNRKLRLPRGELIVIYAMLVMAAPWMGHGIWYRFIGLIYTIPRDTRQARLFHHYSDKLWPHGPQLNRNKDFKKGLEGYFLTIAPSKDEEGVDAPLPDPDNRIVVEELTTNKQDLTSCVAMHTTDIEMLQLRARIPTVRDGKTQLVPGENYLLSYLANIQGAKGSTNLSCYLLTEKGDKTSINGMNRESEESFSLPSAFEPIVRPKVLIPDRLGDHVDVVFEFRGEGTVRIADIRLYNNEAIQSLYQGRTEVAESDLAKLPPNERARVDARPDATLSPRGLAHRLKGSIPLSQWAQPAALWSSMIIVLFLALMATMVIMRRQWAENERFSFPMLIFPRSLLEEETDAQGKTRFALFRKRAMWTGFGIACVIIFGHAMRHYFKFPMFKTNIDIASYVRDRPALYSFFRGFYGHPFNISLLVLPIAFFIELELLGSILLCFFVCSLPFYLREEVFTSWKSIKDFPFVRQQHTGAYMALAVITLYSARHHLAQVFRSAFWPEKSELDDRGEAWSYRVSVAVLCFGILFLSFWTQYVGVGFWAGFVYFSFILLCGLSTARIRTECGTPWCYLTPYTPLIIFTAFGGTYVFGIGMLVIMIVSGGFLCSASYLMCAPTQVEMLQLSKLLNVRPRCVLRGLMLGALGGLVLGGALMLSIGYSKGAMNVEGFGFAGGQSWQIRIVTRDVARHDQLEQRAKDEKTENAKVGRTKAKAKDTKKPPSHYVKPGPAWALGGSFIVTILLFIAKTIWVGFPLHPVGYILANTYFINMVWGSLFTALLIKFVALRAGGVMFVRKVMTPFFVGVFLGTISSYLFWDALALVINAFGYMDTYHVNHVF